MIQKWEREAIRDVAWILDDDHHALERRASHERHDGVVSGVHSRCHVARPGPGVVGVDEAEVARVERAPAQMRNGGLLRTGRERANHDRADDPPPQNETTRKATHGAKMNRCVLSYNDTVHMSSPLWHLERMPNDSTAANDAAIRKVIATIPFGACPLPGIATAGQPDAPAWGSLAGLGFKSVVDLREPDEPRGHDEVGEIARAGLRYLALPVSHESLGDEQFDAIRAFLRDPLNRPVLVHCQSANRVGALLLPYLALDEHLPIEEAQQRAVTVGLRSPDYAALALDYVKRHAKMEG
jgi:protein tyrosine phosphatase (PTP) superfamily phosphohydrolase (DUF442 family)